MRVLLQYLLPLLLPAAIYIGWLYFLGRHQQKRLPHWAEGPWFWLLLAGFLLAASIAIYTGLTTGTKPGAEYVPPRYENGRVVPSETR
jgi:hypothetical protein